MSQRRSPSCPYEAGPKVTPKSLKYGRHGYLTTASWSSDKTTIALSTSRGSLLVIDASTLALLTKIRVTKRPVKCVAPFQAGFCIVSEDNELFFVDEAYAVSKVHNHVELGKISVLASDTTRMLFVGNDEGRVSVCKVVQSKSSEMEICVVQTFNQHLDYISSIYFYKRKNRIIVGSGDGSFSIIGLKKLVLEERIDLTEEVIFVAVHETSEIPRVVVATTDGPIYYFKWNHWDRSSKSPPSQAIVNCAQIVGNALVIADDDGKLRVIEDVTVKSRQENERYFTPKLKNSIERIIALKEDAIKPQILCLQALSKNIYMIELDCSQPSTTDSKKKKVVKNPVEVDTANSFFRLMD